mmetsp:Transcript_18521/g.49566  ORF Transcript_18521/g.49566 Transcript_18521/m.49566 type:complete len:251 (-) Transcript_18521:871-1623(-)
MSGGSDGRELPPSESECAPSPSASLCASPIAANSLSASRQELLRDSCLTTRSRGDPPDGPRCGDDARPPTRDTRRCCFRTGSGSVCGGGCSSNIICSISSSEKFCPGSSSSSALRTFKIVPTPSVVSRPHHARSSSTWWWSRPICWATASSRRRALDRVSPNTRDSSRWTSLKESASRPSRLHSSTAASTSATVVQHSSQKPPLTRTRAQASTGTRRSRARPVSFVACSSAGLEAAASAFRSSDMMARKS